MTSTQTATTQVHRVWIKASRQRVWDAIVDPKWNGRYGYGAPSEYELRTGGAFRVLASQQMRDFGAPEVIIDGQVLEVDPPSRLVQTWHALFEPAAAAEPVTRVTWELTEQNGVTILTVTHELTDAPVTAVMTAGDAADAGGGWPQIVSDLKTFLETGSTMAGAQ